jgi:hypothetical protein
MKKKLIILVALAFTVFASTLSIARSPELLLGSGPGMGTPPKSIYQNSWAVLIAIDNYQYAKHLPYCVADAEAFRHYLTSLGGFAADHVFILYNEKATKSEIDTMLGTLLPKKVGPNDRLLIFFSGHGQSVNLPTGGKMGYLIPVEGNSNNLYGTCLSMSQIKETSKLMPSKHVIYIVDACYSGIIGYETKTTAYADQSLYLKKLTSQRAVQIITAGRANETAIMGKQFCGGQSVFTCILHKGLSTRNADLNGDGIIPASELYAYLSSKVTIASDGHQTPKLFNIDGDGEFVFFTTPRHKPPNKGEQSSPGLIQGPSIGTTVPVGPTVKPLPTLVSFHEPDSDVYRIYKKHCDRGDMKGCFNLGLCFNSGKCGYDKNAIKAGEYYLKACDNDYAAACNNLGVCYETGTCNFLIDEVKAGQCYKKACNHGNAIACNNAGICNKEGGCGFNQNPAKAGLLFNKACNMENLDGCVNLGICYIKGDCGSEMNTHEAGKLFLKACEGENMRGCAYLGDCYQSGKCGYRKNINKARKHYIKACEADIDTACKSLEKLNKEYQK